MSGPTADTSTPGATCRRNRQRTATCTNFMNGRCTESLADPRTGAFSKAIAPLDLTQEAQRGAFGLHCPLVHNIDQDSSPAWVGRDRDLPAHSKDGVLANLKLSGIIQSDHEGRWGVARCLPSDAGDAL